MDEQVLACNCDLGLSVEGHRAVDRALMSSPDFCTLESQYSFLGISYIYLSLH